MYIEHFGLNEKPFSISPDPRYLYLSQRHADALAHLLYGIRESGGFIQLTGEVGTGKTTLIRSVLGQLPEKTEIALILNPQLSTKQFLQAICHELGVAFVQRDTAKSLIDGLNAHLLAMHAADQRVVLIVDEAQTMSPELLEQVRLLTNLETSKRKLLQIILIGQPELRDLLSQSGMRQIAQRITGRYHLEPLDARDTATYIGHRIKVAGGRPEIFSRRALKSMYRLSRGIPRLLNVIADRALLAAYTRDQTRIDARLVRRAAEEVFGTQGARRWWPWAATAAGVALLWLFTTSTIDDSADDAAIELALAETAVIESTGAAALPAAPIASTPATVSLTGLLEGSDETTSTRALFALWDLEFVPGNESACEQAAAQGLRCLALDGIAISELRKLDRPVRLALIGEDREVRHLLLTGLGNETATVYADGRDQKIAIAELTHFDFGEHLLLFRPAIATPEPLSEGAEGPPVIWLRATLESVLGFLPESASPEGFDAGLTAGVRQYQQLEGLTSDGVVGDRTLISLQTEVGLVGTRLGRMN